MKSWDELRTVAPTRAGWGVGFVLGAATLFAVNGPVSKAVLLSGIDAQQLVEIRSAGTAVCFLLIAAVTHRAGLRIGGRELLWITVYGLVGLALVNWLYFVAIARMPVSVALLIEFTAPLWVALWARFVRKEAVRSRIWLALALTALGLALVARIWAGLTLNAIGLIAAVTAAFCLAAYYMMGERALGQRDAISLAAYSFGASAVGWSIVQPWWNFPFARLLRPVGLDSELSPNAFSAVAERMPLWVLVTWVIVMGTVAPYALVLAGLRRIGPTRTGLVGTMEPPMAGLFSWLALGEALTLIQFFGACVVLAGIVVAETARTANEEPTPAQADLDKATAIGTGADATAATPR